MSQEKTEKATPKKQEDARKKGQIARGPELPAALSFLGAVFALDYTSLDVFGRIGYYIQNTALKIAAPKELNQADLHGMFIEAGTIFALVALPVALVALAAVVAGNFAQGGLTLTGSALMPKADKFSPVKNAKRIFGLDAPVNLLKSLLKLSFIVIAAYGVLMPVIETAPLLIHAPLPIIAAKLGATMYSLALRCGVILLALSLAEYGYTLYKHQKSLKMSKQEIHDEYKQQEGDPMIKGQRRRRARELTQRRSMADVPTASVIITNPTHFAVALRYDRDKDAAPIVVAKGADNIAAKIRELARENDIPLIENPPLARALFKAVEPNQTIPAEFFGAVAEILAFVFRRKENL
ncbi:MAG: flagellar biosynthesis protein FlhB [Pyrinomonadaceae bacterium]|nr:flagellar biosynthesis protein FlhB [Pyrinomonadaceae bacterium]